MSTEAPLTVIIFGGTGDLAERKLLPALDDLSNASCLPDNVSIVGFSRKDLSDEAYQAFVTKSLEAQNHTINPHFISQAHYVQGDLTNIESYKGLATYLQQHDEKKGVCTNKLFYLAVPPHLYEAVFKNLAESGMTIPCAEHKEVGAWTRVLVEKPFGNDQMHAQELDALLGSLFLEEQVFRIDHYLAKETVQNILTFRFANTMFEPIWNAENIESIHIDLFEDFDIRNRGAFYDGIGALRDMGQNHMLQMLALIAMEDPQTLDAAAIRQARADVFRALTQADKELTTCVVRGQYDGYTSVDGVADDSQTETFFALTTHINTPRWKGVPFYVRHGKAMESRHAEIRVVFKERATCACPEDDDRSHQNVVTFRIQPDEGISVRFWAKRPGFGYTLDQKELSFSYSAVDERLPDPYERVLYDAIVGDQTLFTSTDEVLAQWDFVSPILTAWKELPLHIYKPGADPDTITTNNT